MKIVTREEFLKLPVGTLYSKYQPCVADEIHIKDETVMDDFCCVDISNSASFLHASDTSEPVNLETPYRDACARDKDQLFAVWELDDLKALAAVVNRAMELAQQ
jgi:hypothetical protein